ncbi:EAL domain-containing protein [Phormidium tenue FACHB-886]|nr:EAL domain-containing protein [Phormidium tenue FACHB-886]
MSQTKILVVEDEIIVATDIQTTLLSLGYDVLDIASTGEEAIQKAQELQPDLILMDIRLQGEIDGVQAAEQIAEQLSIAIIYLTAYADDPTLERAKLTHPMGYILKPFEERELYTTIEIALHKHQMEKQLKANHQWLSTVLQSIGDGVIANDLQERVTFMNPVAESLTRWPQEEAIGRPVAEIFTILNETTRAPMDSPIRQALQKGSTVYLGDNAVLLSKDGTEIPIDDSAAPIKDAGGVIQGGVLVFRDVTEKKQFKQQLIHNAFHDPLTGLPNRALFMDRLNHALEQAKRHSYRKFALLFLDADRFKMINDSLGHAIGDKLLIAIADRLSHCLRSHDTVARMGGDEFAILLDNAPDAATACRTAERILGELNKPFTLDEYEVYTAASIGIVTDISTYLEQSVNPAEDLIRNADIAMYRAKAQGKGRYEIFNTSMYTQVKALLQLETELQRALANDEFRVYYQPIVALANRKIVGFEALVRWQHPQRGLVSPVEFISVAEETGLIILLDWWVLREACRQMQVWQVNYPSAMLSISVNVSSKQFAQPRLVEQVEQILQETGLNPRSLKLELTESAIVENTESATQIFSQLKALGIQLHIDDFGTGYSSLSYLHQFPIDAMKIDRSFISSMGDDDEKLEIARAISMLAHNLEMDVVAEGIETAAQLQLVEALRCPYGQGYFFSMPLDSQATEALIAAQAY